jgi:hypothetical protein
MAAKPCQEPGCERAKWAPRHRCYWHALLTLPIDEQIGYMEKRVAKARGAEGFVERARVPAADWPAGTRWCSGCQWFVPLFYCQGSRCKACSSVASYSSHLRDTYGITYADYKAMYDWQGGRCYICRRQPKRRRLAVDHDHKTGVVRGLLCSDDERGCNHAILGNITSIDMARRIVEYLEKPPFEQVKLGAAAPKQLVEARPTVQGIQEKVRAGKAVEGRIDGPWDDGVFVGTREIMRAHAEGEGINAAGQRVPKGSELDLTTYRVGENPSSRAPERPQERSAGADVAWDALTL